jgi:hypothetical protein
MARWTRVWGHAQGWEIRCARSSDGHGWSLVRAVVSSASMRVAMSAGIRQREWSGMRVLLGSGVWLDGWGWRGEAGGAAGAESVGDDDDLGDFVNGDDDAEAE